MLVAVAVAGAIFAVTWVLLSAVEKALLHRLRLADLSSPPRPRVLISGNEIKIVHPDGREVTARRLTNGDWVTNDGRVVRREDLLV
jgi:hypothetical protein